MNGNSIFVQTKSIRYEVITHGKASTPVFLLHGNSNSSETFTPFISSLNNLGLQAFCINLPGHGNSELPEDFEFSIPALADSIAELVSSLTKDKQFYLLGHSIGAHIFSHAMDSLSNRCRGFISISAPPISLATLANAFAEDPCAGAIFRGGLTPNDINTMASALLGPAADSQTTLDDFRL